MGQRHSVTQLDRQILDQLIAVFPHPLTAREIGEHAGVGGRTVGPRLRVLEREGIVDSWATGKTEYWASKAARRVAEILR